jgi:hypothetical protein
MAFEEIGAKLVVEGEQAFFRTLGQANSDLGSIGTAATTAGNSFASFGRAALATETQIDQLTQKIQLQQRQYALLQQDIQAVTTKYGEGSTQAARKQLALDKLNLSIENNKTELGLLNQKLEAEQTELGQSAQAADQVVTSNQKLDGSLATTGGSFSSFREIATGALRYVGEAAVQFAMQAGGAIAGFVTDSVTAAGDFQAGMNNFAAVTNIDTSGLEEFRDLFLDLGAELPVSTAEVQAAATELAKGGIEPATIAAGGLESALRFAAAAGLDLDAAATIAAKTVGGWISPLASAEEKARFMAESMDLLTKAANASTVDVDELALGLYNAQGAANNAGISLGDTVTTLAAVSSSFASSSEAGNSFKNFIARLQPTTKPATEAMSQLGLYGFDAQRALAFLVEEGVAPLGTSLEGMGDPLEEIDAMFRQYLASTTDLKQGTAEYDKALGALNGQFSNSAFYDAEGKFIGMAEASALLQERTKDLTDEEKAHYLQTIFGNDAMGVASRLAILGAEGYNAMATSMENQAGVQATATIKQQGFNVAMDNFKGSVEALQITLGTYLLPVLESLFNDYLSPGINILRDIASAWGEAGFRSIEMHEVIDNLNPTLGRFFDYFLKARSPLDGVLSVFGNLLAYLGPFGATAQQLIDIFIRGQDTIADWTFLGRNLTAVLGPELGGAAFDLFQKIQGGLGFIGDLVDQFTIARAFGLSWGDSLSMVGNTLGSFILDALPRVADSLVQMREKLFGWITESLPGWLTALGEFAAPMGQWILDAIPIALDAIGTFVRGIVDTAMTHIPQWTAVLAEFAIKAITWIADALPGLVDNLTAFATKMINWVVESIPEWAANLAHFGGKIAGWVLDALPGLLGNLGTVTGKLLGWILETAVDVVPKLLVLGGKFISWVITDVLPELPGALAKIWEGLSAFVGNVSQNVGPLLSDLGKRFYTWIAETVIPALPGALEAIKSTINGWITGALSWAGSALLGIGSSLVSGIQQGFANAWGAFLSWIDSKIREIPGPIRDALGIGSPSKVMALEVGRWIPAGIIEGIKMEMPALEAEIAAMITPQLVNGYTPSNMLAGQMSSNVSNVTHNFTQNVQTTSATFAAQSYALARLRV